MFKEITVHQIVIDAKVKQVVTTTYRFNDPKDKSIYDADENSIPERAVFDYG